MRRCSTPVHQCVILAGGLSASPLVKASGYSVLDFQVTPRRTLLEQWLHCFELARPFVGPRSEVILACSPESIPVPFAINPDRTQFEVRRALDAHGYRGPAGALRDVAIQGDPDDVILVAEAARCFEGGIGPFIDAHIRQRATVTVGTNEDGSPAGVYVIQRRALAGISERGFVDLKEQWLPRLVAEGHSVCVNQIGVYSSIPLRTRADLIRTAGQAMGWSRERELRMGAFAASTRRSTAISSVIAIDSRVAAGATVVDSVICRGAVVEEGAILAHTIVCPGARVRTGETHIRTVVSNHDSNSASAGEGNGGAA